MSTIYEIPKVSFSKEDYDSEKKEITINLNNFRWLDDFINSYRKSHRRWIPQISVVSPTGVSRNFAYPKMEGANIVFENKGVRVVLKYA